MDKLILDKEIYIQKTYLNKERWASYYWQAELIRRYSSPGDRILKVGVGNKIISEFLSTNFLLTTLDINPQLKPDILASVEDLSELKTGSFDNVLCAEVLEHLPFEKFETSLNELKRVSKKYLIISLPYWGFTFGFKIKLPILGKKTFKFKISGLKKHDFRTSTAGHYWEIGKKEYSLKRIKKVFKKVNLKVIESFWDLDDSYHYYFVLEKKYEK